MNAAEQEPPITPAPDCPTRLALHDMGFSLIPLKPRNKNPLIPWRAYQKRRAAHSDVEAWFKAAPNANIGIVTGAISGLVVLDLDSADAVVEAERRGLPDTLMVRTGKGRHVYFRHPGYKITNRAGFLPGMDIRGDGGYIVGPGSIHPSGAQYTWDNPPGQITLAEMPDWLVRVLGAEPAAKVAAPAVRLTTPARGASSKRAKGAPDAAATEPTTFCAVEQGLARLLDELLGVNRRSIGTPYRRAKGTPLLRWWVVDAGRGFRAAGGVGRA